MMVEKELRRWLYDACYPLIDIQWVEPGRYGSTTGAADAILHAGRGYADIYLELKIWELTRRGVKCNVRPVQRQWHHKMMRKGNKCAILFNIKGTDEIYLLRGDHVPLRDYADDQNSGCIDGKLRSVLVSSGDRFKELLYGDDDLNLWV